MSGGPPSGSGSPRTPWTPERFAAATPAPWPAHEPLRPRPPEAPRPLGGAPARVARSGRPVFWVLEADTAGPGAVRHGLRLLLGAEFGVPPERPVVEDGPCERCGAVHGIIATDGARPGAPPVYVGLAAAGATVVYALSDTPVGVGVPTGGDDGPDAVRAARAAARRAAYEQLLPRGRCGEPGRDGPMDLARLAVPGAPAAVAVWSTGPWPAPRPPGERAPYRRSRRHRA
ncbi:hypothetical protein ACFYUL_28455 [Streptomyces sp. NPDC004311]|uniref:hypothetical protein n=1 Tax=Streptomyces sp. NPDC004311 TaxID=3364698 RepID=UPI003688C292